MIITNAAEGWVELSAVRFLPKTVLTKSHICLHLPRVLNRKGKKRTQQCHEHDDDKP